MINNIRPGVSIILPTYNREKTLGKSIESVLAQTYREFELIVIDDGSTDDTESVVRSYTDSRIVYYKLEENKGQSAARNFAMKKAKYDYLAFEDSDDIWYPQKLERQMEVLLRASEQVGMVYHKMRYEIDGYGELIVPDEMVPVERKSGSIYAQLLWKNMIGMPALLVKKSCVDEIGYLDEELNCLEDYDWVLRIAKRYHALFLDEVLLDAGYSTTGVSGQASQHVVASCMLVQKYKEDYLQTNTFNHRLECILADAEDLGIKEQVIQLLERIMRL